MNRYKRVEVIWEDSSFTQFGWTTPKESRRSKIMICRTIGYLTRKSKKKLVVVNSICTNGMVSDSTVIPRACVKKIKRMK